MWTNAELLRRASQHVRDLNYRRTYRRFHGSPCIHGMYSDRFVNGWTEHANDSARACGVWVQVVVTAQGDAWGGSGTQGNRRQCFTFGRGGA